MKVRDSGMPEERVWSSFYNVGNILSILQVDHSILNVMEVGCGYGTFTIEAAKRISGKLYAFDIEPEMVNVAQDKAIKGNIPNIEFIIRDMIADRSGLPSESMDYVMLFNILHHENPMDLLVEAHFVLKKGGKAGIIHWRSDIETPRGPELSIRPTPSQCVEWALQSGFEIEGNPILLEPFHYGLVIRKP
jgi:ubiquinone/menaquinone biosynthesis C-methylase UbiE